MRYMSDNRILVMIPTYNERENAVGLYEHLKKIDLDLDILFIDDGSPDGTGVALSDLSKKDQSLHVIHRKGKLGIGSAHKDGIAWAYASGYKSLVTMDGDYAHSPDDIDKFLEHSRNYDVVVGTRFIKQDSMVGLPFIRRFLSLTAHFMTQYCLRMPYDATNGFRLYRLDRIPDDLFDNVMSDSYCFFFESIYILHVNDIPIVETPISLGGRLSGKSNMSLYDVMLSIRMLMILVFRKYFRFGSSH